MMANSWAERRSSIEIERKGDYRSPFQRDRGRLIHSAAFRRLQSKTQVLGLGDSDYYRTRLTHSIEAAQIGSGIKRYLETKKNNHEFVSHLPDDDLIITICLGHDLGHPPFGHGGEIALNFMMNEFGGFEGNGQTLRIISRLEKYIKEYGMDLTRRAMLGVLKYPANYSKIVKNEYYPKSKPDNYKNIKPREWKPPKCYFDSECDVVEWILEPLSEEDRDRFVETKDSDKHYKTKFKSFDTSIMELADDIAYGVHDLEDGVALKLVQKEQWLDEVAGQLEEYESGWVHKELTEKLFSSDSHERKYAIGELVNWFIVSVEVEKDNGFKENLLKYNAKLPANIESVLKILKDFVNKNIIRQPEVKILEYKGQQMILDIFTALNSDPEYLLPKDIFERHKESHEKIPIERVITDYIAGMTDEYAVKIFQKLFVPKKGSIFDRL